MAVLLDTLQRPGADLGLKLPSLLEWRHHEDRAVDHLVLWNIDVEVIEYNSHPSSINAAVDEIPFIASPCLLCLSL